MQFICHNSGNISTDPVPFWGNWPVCHFEKMGIPVREVGMRVQKESPAQVLSIGHPHTHLAGETINWQPS